MKSQLLTLCLLATLPAWAQSTPAPEALEAPEAPAATPPPAPPRSPQLEAQRQELESDIQRLESEAQRLDPEGRLDSNQLFELLKDRERRASRHDNPDIAPIIISVALFSSLLMGFLAWLLARNRKHHQLHQTVRMMVEKGVEVPPGLLAPAPKKPSDLRRGIILSTTGVGLTIFLAALPDSEGAWGVGVTLFFLGLGHLLVWRLQQGRSPLASRLSPESPL
ncbi:hypothetical protein F0U62_29380 [Cystobacter fuscus]|uniref:DUF6249 domain-containing protein n=1 Tax=Cystobacter fuscus TaxID=43 RepID=UPI002B310142|nr:hypothetical protein F0U62_29380 [Cystobacter fuscus]